jgi:hypothetical protein
MKCQYVNKKILHHAYLHTTFFLWIWHGLNVSLLSFREHNIILSSAGSPPIDASA